MLQMFKIPLCLSYDDVSKEASKKIFKIKRLAVVMMGSYSSLQTKQLKLADSLSDSKQLQRIWQHC